MVARERLPEFRRGITLVSEMTSRRDRTETGHGKNPSAYLTRLQLVSSSPPEEPLLPLNALRRFSSRCVRAPHSAGRGKIIEHCDSGYCCLSLRSYGLLDCQDSDCGSHMSMIRAFRPAPARTGPKDSLRAPRTSNRGARSDRRSYPHRAIVRARIPPARHRLSSSHEERI